MKQGYIYILTNLRRTTFYIGVTSNLRQRLLQHQSGLVDGFSKKYQLHYLIYYEVFFSITEAITREKQLKNWHRDWKLNLIKSVNPDLKDLSAEIPLSSRTSFRIYFMIHFNKLVFKIQFMLYW